MRASNKIKAITSRIDSYENIQQTMTLLFMKLNYKAIHLHSTMY